MAGDTEPKGFESNQDILRELTETALRNDRGKESVSYGEGYLGVTEEGYRNPTRNTSIQNFTLYPETVVLSDHAREWSTDNINTAELVSSVRRDIVARSNGTVELHVTDAAASEPRQIYDVTRDAATLGITAELLNKTAIIMSLDGEAGRDDQQWIIDNANILRAIADDNGPSKTR